MKSFLTSLFIGSAIGMCTAFSLLIVVPKLPDIFAHSFFYPNTSAVFVTTKSDSEIFQPREGQYMLDRLDKNIPPEGKVVYADLKKMNIVVFEDMQEVAKYPIQSIGREGTPWQTPLGIFDMNYKTERHFSSIGSVWMPYSIHFFGNYFIHGWPYYSNGTPVAEGYSGGCIRLETEDAQELFQFVDSKTQLIVIHDSYDLDKQKEYSYVVTDFAPSIDSSFMIIDLDQGEVVASHNSQTKIPIGSFTKIMNALISLETLNQYLNVVYNQDIITIGDLIYPLLLEDGLEAGILLSEAKNKRQYLLDMNTRAKSIGMFDTEYLDANGKDSQTISTLDDMARLLIYIYEYKPFLIDVLSKKTYTSLPLIVNRIYPEINTYQARFIDLYNNSIIALFKYNSYAEEEDIENTFAIIVHDSLYAKKDAQILYDWAQQSLELRK